MAKRFEFVVEVRAETANQALDVFDRIVDALVAAGLGDRVNLTGAVSFPPGLEGEVDVQGNPVPPRAPRIRLAGAAAGAAG